MVRTEGPLAMPSPLAGALALSLCLVSFAGEVSAQWVAPLSRMSPAPTDLTDGRRPLAERVAAARALGRYGSARDAVETLLLALEREPPPVLRDAILRALARRGRPDAVRTLRTLLERDRASAPAVLDALGAIADSAALTALVEAMQRDVTARSATRVLERLGPTASEALLSALAGPTPIRATRLLGVAGDTTVVPALLDALAAPGSGDGPRAAPLALAIALVGALGTLGDDRAAPALASLLEDPSRALRDAALLALGEVTAPASAAGRLAQFAGQGSIRMRVAALRALARCDPASAAVSSSALLAPDTADGLRAGAVDVLVEHPRLPFVPVLARLLGEPAHAARAGSALARVEAGAGIEALSTAVAAGQRDLARPLALALRRWADALAREQRQRGYGLLRALPAGPRRLLLRALSGDTTVVGAARAALVASSAATRASGARALELLQRAPEAREVAPALGLALAAEADPEAARRMLDAARALQLPLPWAALWDRFDAMATGAAAMRAMADQAVRSGKASHRLRRALRERLRSGPLALRVSAALALASIGDAPAVAPLAVALEDPAAVLRAAAARALGVLGGARARAVLRVQRRIEHDQEVRRALNGALAALDTSPPRARVLRGDHALELRILRAEPQGADSAGATDDGEVEVVLPDGRWLRLRPLPGGELLVADLPAGNASVRPAGAL